MAQEMDSRVFALATVGRFGNHTVRMPWHNVKVKKILQLLDSIALILVTDGEGEAAAVAMEQLSDAVTFYYSKNAPCSSEFREYLQRLTTICASDEGDDFIGHILVEVFTQCHHKIKNRLIKCQKEIKLFKNITFDAKVAAHVPKAAIQDESWRGKSFGEIVKDFFKSLGDYEMEPHKGGSIEASIVLCMQAYIIGHEPGLLLYPILARRIQNFGDYYGAALRFQAAFMDPKLAHLRKKISMREIRPTQPRLVEVTRNAVEILNDYAEKDGYKKINTAAFTRAFQQPVQENGKRQEIKVSSHCELTLALHFYEKMSRSKNFVEIGLSKGCCWLCEQFLDALSRQEKNVVIKVSRNQGKIHAGWGMPDTTPSSVAEKILKRIDQELSTQSLALSYHLSKPLPTVVDLDTDSDEILDRV